MRMVASSSGEEGGRTNVFLQFRAPSSCASVAPTICGSGCVFWSKPFCAAENGAAAVMMITSTEKNMRLLEEVSPTRQKRTRLAGRPF